MIHKFLNRLFAFDTSAKVDPLEAGDARLAFAALLVRVARSDESYAAAEVARIDRVLSYHYNLDAEGAADLRREAEQIEAGAPDTVRFTRALKAATSIEDRGALMQALWSVALADGERDAQEDRLMRMVASLLGLSDVENAQSRQRAQAQM